MKIQNRQSLWGEKENAFVGECFVSVVLPHWHINNFSGLCGPDFVLLYVDPKSITSPSPTFFFFFKVWEFKNLFSSTYFH